MRGALALAHGQLALDHTEDVRGHARVEADAPFGRVHDIALDELAHRTNELLRAGHVVWSRHLVHHTNVERSFTR